jgi:MoxR-like ATPase
MADELNRASARTQSAMLEAMEENQVSVDGKTLTLPHPFMVIATQNPHDAAGTSLLPHSQRDRFLLRISLGYPTRAEEDRLIRDDDPAVMANAIPPAINSEELSLLMKAIAEVFVSGAARQYLLDLVAATRKHRAIRIGASPRAARAVTRVARAIALSESREFVIPSDIQKILSSALAHRIVLHAGGYTPEAAEEVIEEILRDVAVPTPKSPPRNARHAKSPAK